MIRWYIAAALAAGPAVVSYAQLSKVTSAYNYMEYGQLDKAKEAIDAAVAHEQTSASAKAWHYRGEIYFRLLLSEKEADRNLDPAALDKAHASYRKTMELDEKEKFTAATQRGLDNCRKVYYNNGAQSFNDKDYERSHYLFSNAVSIAELLGTVDTNALFFGGQAAYYAKAYDTAAVLLGKTAALNIRGGDAWYLLAGTYLASGDSASWEQAIREGSRRYPGHKGLTIEEVNLLLDKKMYSVAKDKLKAAVVVDPENVTLYYNLGLVYDQLEDKANAESAYKKAIQIRPDYLDAIYNLGALYYNEGIKIIQAADELEGAAYEAGKKKADAEFAAALIYLERAYKLDPTDRNTLHSLKQLYIRRNNEAGLKEINTRLGE